MTWFWKKREGWSRRGRSSFKSMKLWWSNNLIRSWKGNINKFNWSHRMRKGNSKFKSWESISNSKNSWSSIEGKWFRNMIRSGGSSKMRKLADNKTSKAQSTAWIVGKARKIRCDMSWRICRMSSASCKLKSMSWKEKLKVNVPRNAQLKESSTNWISQSIKRNSLVDRSLPKCSGYVMRLLRRTPSSPLQTVSISRFWRLVPKTLSQAKPPDQHMPTTLTLTSLNPRSPTSSRCSTSMASRVTSDTSTHTCSVTTTRRTCSTTRAAQRTLWESRSRLSRTNKRRLRRPNNSISLTSHKLRSWGFKTRPFTERSLRFWLRWRMILTDVSNDWMIGQPRSRKWSPKCD